MSATSGKQDRSRPRLEVLPGGRSDHDAGGVDWHEFTQRIGWQQLTEPALPDDYEDRLVARLFAPAEHKLVSLEAERVRRGGAPSLSVATEARRPVVGLERRGTHRWDLGWQLAAVAVVAMLVAGAALLVWRGGEAPPAANTVPTPVPERVPSPATPEPPAPDPDVQQPLPEPRPSVPDPGVRLVERAPAPTRAWRSDHPVAKVGRTVAARQAGESSHGVRDGVDYRISPESEPAPGGLPLLSQATHLGLRAEAAHRPTIRLAAQPAGGRAPTWHHLAMADGRSGAQSMALVDLLELDRRLSEAL